MSQPLSLREIITRTIDAEPTDYRGVHMRSRLEADFARHLDGKGIEWIYEPEIFGPLGRGYLPDFLLTSGPEPCYVEIKPTIEQAESAKLQMPVIWVHKPSALLLIVSAEGNRFYARAPWQPWEEWAEAWAHAA